MTKEQIQSLPERELRCILLSTVPTSAKFALEINWAMDELARRQRERDLRPARVA